MKLKKTMITAAVMILTAVAVKAQNATQNATGGTTTTTTTTEVVTTGDDRLWNNPKGWWEQHAYYDKDTEHRRLFNQNEFNFDLFGTYLNPERAIKSVFNANIRHGNWGGGVGANYFWSRDVGLGVDTSFQDSSGPKFVDHVGGNLIVRFPLEVIRTSPYILGGGGYKWNPIGSWFGDFGAGLEFRFNRHTGLFGDATYIFLDKAPVLSSGHEQLYIRAGLRLGF